MAHPESIGYAEEGVAAWVRIGNLQSQIGDLREAAQSYQEAHAVVEVVRVARPQNPALQVLLAAVLEREGSNFAGGGQSDAGSKLLLRAADLARPAVGGGSSAVKARETLSEVLWQLARLYRAQGEDGKAQLLERERSALWPDPYTGGLVDLASSLAARSNLIGYGKTPVPTEGETSRRLDRQQAADCLRLALAHGFRDLGKIKANPDLAALLGRNLPK